MSRSTNRHTFWPRVAFLAMAGMVWVASGFVSTAKADSGSCCVIPMEAGDCRCCVPAAPEREASAAAARESSAVVVIVAESTRAAAPCGCVAEAPASPRESLPAPRPNEPRPTESHAGALLAPLAMVDLSLLPARCLDFSPKLWPPSVPLFLRDARLRF